MAPLVHRHRVQHPEAEAGDDRSRDQCDERARRERDAPDVGNVLDEGEDRHQVQRCVHDDCGERARRSGAPRTASTTPSDMNGIAPRASCISATCPGSSANTRPDPNIATHTRPETPVLGIAPAATEQRGRAGADEDQHREPVDELLVEPRRARGRAPRRCSRADSRTRRRRPRARRPSRRGTRARRAGSRGRDRAAATPPSTPAPARAAAPATSRRARARRSTSPATPPRRRARSPRRPRGGSPGSAATGSTAARPRPSRPRPHPWFIGIGAPNSSHTPAPASTGTVSNVPSAHTGPFGHGCTRLVSRLAT